MKVMDRLILDRLIADGEYPEACALVTRLVKGSAGVKIAEEIDVVNALSAESRLILVSNG